MRAEIADGETRKRLIIWIRRHMANCGITFEALAASIQHYCDNGPVYRDGAR